MSTVSLVISVWNRKDDLRENLQAIQKQTRSPMEVIVVDNASEDGTADMVRTEFPEVRLIRMPHSGYGACETFNIGFANARGEYVGILDDDVVLPPDFIERMLAEFQKEPETTVVLSPKVVDRQSHPFARKDAALVPLEVLGRHGLLRPQEADFGY